MAFITQSSTFYSFADYADVVALDSRLFQTNEGLSSDSVEDACIRSTTRILDQIRNTDWWKGYYIHQSGSFNNVVIAQSISVPAPDPFLIRARQQDFTDLCCYHALSQYLYPRVADFGNPDNAERQKIGFYDQKYRVLFDELIQDGDWYDFDNSGTVTAAEKSPNRVSLVRTR